MTGFIAMWPRIGWQVAGAAQGDCAAHRQCRLPAHPGNGDVFRMLAGSFKTPAVSLAVKTIAGPTAPFGPAILVTQGTLFPCEPDRSAFYRAEALASTGNSDPFRTNSMCVD